MNLIIRRAHQIRREAAARFGGSAGQYSMKIACEMAKRGESVMDFEEYTIVDTKQQKREQQKVESAEARKLAREIAEEIGLNPDKAVLQAAWLTRPVVLSEEEYRVLGAHKKTAVARRQTFLEHIAHWGLDK